MTEDLALKASQLREQINYHSYRYYVLSDPILSDAEFDSLFDELRALEAEHPELITPDSPTQRAGSDLSEEFPKVRHPAPILSLSNAYTIEELRAWEERNRKLLPAGTELDYTLEPKLDGLTIVLTYENGILVQGATRGNGLIGDDVTPNVRTVRTIPLRIPTRADGPPPPERLVVRGEVLYLKHDFEAVNRRQIEQGQPVYVNARNTASGSLKQKDSRVTASRPLTAYVYSVIESVGIRLEKQWEMLEYLRDMGFNVVPNAAYYPTLEAVIQQIPTWESSRNQLDFEIDGIVIKVNDLRIAAELGVVGKDPRSAIAYKFPAQEATTKLIEHVVSVGRTGRVVPSARLEPVFLGGVTVSSATLHNYEIVRALDIRLGDQVVIKRAGDVIPNVVGPVLAARTGAEIPIVPPDRCPFCDTPLVRPEGAVDYFCPNVYCPERVYRQVEFFVSRGALDIDGMGGQTVKALIAQGLIRDEADIFFLTAEQLLPLEGFGEKKVRNLLASIEAAKSRPLARLITALGIDGVGSTVAAALATTFKSLDRLATASVEELQAIDGIGIVLAHSIAKWFADPHHREVLEKLRRAGVNMQDATAARASETLAGLTFVLTGTLPTMTRDEATALIEAHGGKVTSSVSKKTNYVVVGEAAGSKAEKAAQLGIPMLSEEELRQLIEALDSRA
ncbi:MAG: NAD-dependent DNA ligase LigA [Aggregatilineales bacterium]